ncbi:MAG: Stp1/IreP family PP2C-type Ser/Thr phosphatase [Bacteriovoracaceae bacterium]
MTIISSGASDIGQKRKTNQDSICVYPKRHFFAVADGMGGHSGGDIASQMSVKLFPEFIEQNISRMSAPDLLKNSIEHVNEAIYEHGQKNQELKGMGTTVSAIIFDGANINLANVGDSRVYLISKNKLYQMTRDHSLVQEKLNMGFYDRDGAKKDPQKNVLIRTVGFESEVEVDVYHYKVARNDMFLICSDGLHGKVSDEDIIHIVNQRLPDPSAAGQEELDSTVKELIDQANTNGGQDNISVVMALAK